jgi:hypothetical protein
MKQDDDDDEDYNSKQQCDLWNRNNNTSKQ